MPVKAIILDVSNTLIQTQSNNVVEGVPQMLAHLREHNVQIFLASTHHDQVNAAGLLLGVEKENWLSKLTVAGRKGSGKFVEAACERANIGRNEVIYLGDDSYDFYEAVNSHVLFFLASWARSNLQYGIPVETPMHFGRLITTFFLKEHLWYYRVDEKDTRARPIVIRALVGPDEARNTGVRDLLKSQGTTKGNPINGYPLSTYLTLHLLASIYLEGLHLTGPIWCIYPGHDGAQTGTLHEFAEIAARLFKYKKRFQPTLIERHTTTESNRILRTLHRSVTLDLQLSTIKLNPGLSVQLRGQTILVIDDFTTDGYAFETARNFLYNAGATRVVCIAVGKYGNSAYQFFTPRNATTWDSFNRAPVREIDFSRGTANVQFDKEANQYFSPRGTTAPPKASAFNAPAPRTVQQVRSNTSSVPKNASKPVNGMSHPLLTLITQRWPEVLAHCGQQSRSVRALLTVGQAVDVKDARDGTPPTIVIAVPYNFHYQKLNSASSRKMISEALEQVASKRVIAQIVLKTQ